MNKSPDVANELIAISISLSTQKCDEDKDNDIVGNVRWIFNDRIGNEEDGSDILEAV